MVISPFFFGVWGGRVQNDCVTNLGNAKLKNEGFFWLHDLLRSFLIFILRRPPRAFDFGGVGLLSKIDSRCHHSSTCSSLNAIHLPTCLHSQDLQSSQKKRNKNASNLHKEGNKNAPKTQKQGNKTFQTLTKKETKISKCSPRKKQKAPIKCSLRKNQKSPNQRRSQPLKSA